ncbi:MAG: hypothetical protein ABIV10_08350, partial [Gemmatimonadaceae bacterium]
MHLPTSRSRLLGALLLLAPTLLAGQDTTMRGVRIGLTYDPGSKPGVVVLPVAGLVGDSIATIVGRDLDFGDRITVIALAAGSAGAAARGSGPNWPLLARLGAAAA